MLFASIGNHEANTVDEERVLQDLEGASGYERGLGRLDEAGKAIVKKLKEWAGDLVNVTGKRHMNLYTSKFHH
jgi:hypothetical protein